ncbi:TauD/TfdA dioxygenase family protein [Tunicatimonas pelagia]|uniref:TauD/TfdA dioxygenase family protein n=1 Tax=Tunicatimonas pelagia TaxID=931531 RepID=UPI002665EAFE|nr:TauD/TfdA family dioxygenase [Tunicatimonas pelagia]WKN41867.1 TauD/TfdA family dioxygenase [Tunicatimonas pelagia]
MKFNSVDGSDFVLEETGSQPLKEVSDQEIDDIKAALANHGVAVFHHQTLSDTDFANFLSKLGELTFTEGEKHAPDEPRLNVVSNKGRKTPPRSVFHTDTSYVKKTPAFTALKIIDCPASGGETLFTSQYRAYDELDDTLKQELKNSEVLHQVTGINQDEHQLSETETWHPLFLTHPISGKKTIYLSTPERCVAIRNTSLGNEVIRKLYDYATEEQRIYRHSWQPGDVVIWDNRCTLHRADHSAVVGDRVFHRGMVI